MEKIILIQKDQFKFNSVTFPFILKKTTTYWKYLDKKVLHTKKLNTV